MFVTLAFLLPAASFAAVSWLAGFIGAGRSSHRSKIAAGGASILAAALLATPFLLMSRPNKAAVTIGLIEGAVAGWFAARHGYGIGERRRRTSQGDVE